EELPDEGQRRRERAEDVLLLAEAMPLALEGEVRVRDSLALEHLDHRLGLARRHDLVVEPLQQEQWPLEPVGEVNGGAGAVDIGALGIRADHRVEVDRKSTRLNSSHQITSYAV